MDHGSERPDRSALATASKGNAPLGLTWPATFDPSHPPGCLTITAATNVAVHDAGIQTFLRDLRNANLKVFQDRLSAAQQAGELSPDADPHALAGYFATVIQGMSQRARDGAGTAELNQVAELTMSAWPGHRPSRNTDLTTLYWLYTPPSRTIS
jgi:hypothetical protein